MRDVAEAADRGRTPQQITLYRIAKSVLQELKLGAGLELFRQHRKAKSAAESQHRANNRRCRIVRVDRLRRHKLLPTR